MTTQKFEFDRVVFYGRNIDEYVDMFSLDLAALSSMKVLDCCAGPASFALQAAERGISVVACDPMYELDAAELARYVREDAAAVAKRQAPAIGSLLWDQDLKKA